MPRMLTQISSKMGLTALGRFGRSYVQTDEVGLRTLPHLFSLPLAFHVAVRFLRALIAVVIKDYVIVLIHVQFDVELIKPRLLLVQLVLLGKRTLCLDLRRFQLLLRFLDHMLRLLHPCFEAGSE